MTKAFIFFPSVLRACLPLAIVVFMGRQYGSSALGEFYLVVAWFTLGSVFLCFGLNNFFIRFSGDESNQLALSAVLSGYLFAAFILFGLYFVGSSVWFLVAGFCFVKASYLLFEAYKVSKNQYVGLSGLNVTIFLGVLFALWLSKNFDFTAMEALVTAGLCECLVLASALRSVFKSDWHKYGRFTRLVFGSSYARSLWVLSVLNVSLFSLDRIILERVMSSEAVAIYGTLIMVFMTTHRFFTTPYLTWRSRQFYFSQDQSIFFISVIVGSVILALGVVLLNFLAPFIFQFLGVVSPPTLNIQLVSLNVLILYGYTALYSEFKNNMDLAGLGRVTILLATTSVALNLAFIPQFGITGALCAFFLAYLISFVYLFWLRAKL